MTMTSRQRVEAAFRHEAPDRTPMFEYVLLAPVADQLLGRPYAVDPSHWPDVLAARGWEAAVRQTVVDRLDLAALLGHDLTYLWPNPLPAQSDTGLHAAPAAPSDDPVERMRRRNEAAAAADPSPPDDALRVYAMAKEEMARRRMDLPILAPAYAHGVWTDVDLMMTMALAPEVAHEHFALATRRSLAAAEKFIALGVDLIGAGGDFAGQRPIISPAAYRTFIVPEVRKVADRVRAAGRRAVNASDGDLWPVLDDFLVGCGVDGYLEIDLGAGMDLARLKAAYGDRATLLGNLDCGNTLSFAAPEEVRRHTIRCLEAGLGCGGHILCASNAITASVPPANYVAVVQAYRDFFGLGRLDLPT